MNSFLGDLEQLGCYSNKSPTYALPDSFDDHVSSVSGADAIFNYCKTKAESSGYKIFGVDDKNCWSDNMKDYRYDKYGKSKQLCLFSNAGTGNAHGQHKYGNVFVYKMEWGKVVFVNSTLRQRQFFGGFMLLSNEETWLALLPWLSKNPSYLAR